MASLPIAPAPAAASRGVSVWLLRWLVLKELIDNALDAPGSLRLKSFELV